MRSPFRPAEQVAAQLAIGSVAARGGEHPPAEDADVAARVYTALRVGDVRLAAQLVEDGDVPAVSMWRERTWEAAAETAAAVPADAHGLPERQVSGIITLHL